MFKKKNKVENKNIKRSLTGIIVSLILIPAFSVLYIIGLNSTMLIVEPLRYVIIFLLAISLVVFIFCVNYYLNHKKDRKRRLKKKIKIIVITIYVIYFICCNGFLILLYGENSRFRTWLITTAMQTMNHKYLCQWFYNDDIISDVMAANSIDEINEDTNLSLININQSKWKKDSYENEYEEAILDVSDDIKYKIIEFEVNGCNAYLAVIYDPSMVQLAVTKNVGKWGQYVTAMAADHDALLAVNGGGFHDPGLSSSGGNPTGVVISNGKIVTNNKYPYKRSSGGLIGFTKDNVLVLKKEYTAQGALDEGIRDAVTWGPFLIVNGKASFIRGNGGWGYAARTAIGQRADGIVLLLVVDSNATRTKGASMVDLTEIMQNYGAVNAANLDGGTSSVMVLPKTIAQSKYNATCSDLHSDEYCDINDPVDGGLSHRSRAIADAWIVVDN